LLHILYLDDDPIILDIGKSYLEKDGEFIVDTTSSADEALSLLSQFPYDGIVSDYLMPYMNGIEFLKLVRKNHPNIPFIFFTGKGNLEVVVDAINNGADFFLHKDPEPLVRLFELNQLLKQGAQRYRTEKQLKQNEEMFRTLADHTTDWEYLIDQDGKFAYISPSCEWISGYRAEEFKNDPDLLTRIIAPQCRDTWNTHITQEKPEHDSFSMDVQIIHKNGTLKWMNHVCKAIFDDTNNFQGRRVSNRDITEKKQNEKNLKDSEEAFRAIFNNQQAMMLIDAKNHIIVRINQEGAGIIGLPEDQIVGKACHEFVCPAEREKCPISDLHLEMDHAERVLISHARGEIPVIKTVKPVTIQGNEFFIESFTDISQLKQYQNEILRISTENQLILDNMPTMIWYKDTGNTIVRVNTSGAATFGLSIADIEGKSCDELFPEFSEKYYADDLEIIRTKTPKLSIIEEMVRANGERLWILSDKIPLFDTQGDVTGLLIFSRDITDQKNTEDALKVAVNKLRLLSNITRHDILNQIQVLVFSIEIIKRNNLDTKIQEDIERISSSVHNIKRQILFTRDYQDIGIESPVWQDLKMTIIRAIRPVRLEPIEIIIDIPDMLIFADPLLEKVFYNLADNAKRYGKKITKLSFITHTTLNGLILSVEDDGVGVPAHLKSAIFKREYYHNTGFGLNLSREILSITGLTIEETGEPEIGARFEIFIPSGLYRMK
jgi:PAS domain S-box-containing protein